MSKEKNIYKPWEKVQCLRPYTKCQPLQPENLAHVKLSSVKILPLVELALADPFLCFPAVWLMSTCPRKSLHSAALSVLLHENFPEMLPDINNLIFYFINSFPATFEILKSFQSIAFSSQKIKSVCAERRPLISLHRRKSSNDIAKHLAGNYQLSYV